MDIDAASGQLIRAHPRVVSCELKGEMALLDLRSNTYYGLNKIGAYIWEIVQEPRSVSQICEALIERYEVDPERCRVDVETLVCQLADAKLVNLGDEGAS